MRFSTNAILAGWLLMFSATAFGQPCLIFVHGKSTDTDTFSDYNAARDYWQDDGDDFIRTATKNFQTPYYVVGYNGTKAYFDAEAAGEVATEIVNASNGAPDAGGNACARSHADGGSFWVIAHSMGGTVMDFVLGNADPSDQNYNFSGPFETAAQRVGLVVSTGGAHRGSEGADAACGDSSGSCNFVAQFIQDCDTATYWLRSADEVQVRTYSSAPVRNVFLTGGYEAIFGASACLSGEDDGIVQHASQYACGGAASVGYDNDDVCDNSFKQEISGFFNLDTAHENHSDERDASDSDTRRQIPDGIWNNCSGGSCDPGEKVQNSMTTAEFVTTLY